MRPVLTPGLSAALLALVASSASAQTAVVAKRRPVIPVQPAPAAPTVPPAYALPAPPQRLTLNGLRTPGDGGAGCRATCARNRYACEEQGESCAPEWTDCLKTCSTPAPLTQSALLPR